MPMTRENTDTAWEAMLEVLREAEKLHRPTDAMAEKIEAANAALDEWERWENAA